jgi:hypothetical protein
MRRTEQVFSGVVLASAAPRRSWFMGICCLLAGLGVLLASLCLVGWVLLTDRRCGLWLLGGTVVFVMLRLTVCTECQNPSHNETLYCGAPPVTQGAAKGEVLSEDQIARNQFLQSFFEKGVWVYGLTALSRAIFLLVTTKRELVVGLYKRSCGCACALKNRVWSSGKTKSCGCGAVGGSGVLPK